MTTDPSEHRLCLAGQPSHDHNHRCGAPYGHGGPEHCCQVCGGWYRRDGGSPSVIDARPYAVDQADIANDPPVVR